MQKQDIGSALRKWRSMKFQALVLVLALGFAFTSCGGSKGVARTDEERAIVQRLKADYQAEIQIAITNAGFEFGKELERVPYHKREPEYAKFEERKIAIRDKYNEKEDEVIAKRLEEWRSKQK